MGKRVAAGIGRRMLISIRLTRIGTVFVHRMQDWRQPILYFYFA